MRTEILNVKGMTCGGCTSAVTKALKATQGDLSQGEVTVQIDQAGASLADLRVAVSRAGFEVVDKPSSPKAGGCCGGQKSIS